MTQVPLPRLGRYRLLEVLAGDGPDEVYKAEEEGPAGDAKAVVMVKRVPPHLTRARNFLQMFIEAIRLSHPNVVQLFELGVSSGEYYVVTEYLVGPSLHQVHERLRQLGRPFPVALAAGVVAQALQGLHYAHTLCDKEGQPLGIVHRGLQPENIRVTREGLVKVADFGIAQAVHAPSQTPPGVPQRKLPYLSPEQVYGLPASPRSDIYAAGVVLYELLTGVLPSRASSSEALVEQITTVEPEPPRQLALNVPPGLNDIVLKALRKNPRERFASAQEMSRALLESLEPLQRRAFPEELGGLLEQLALTDPPPQSGKPTRWLQPPPEPAATSPLPGHAVPETSRTVTPPPPRTFLKRWGGLLVLLAAAAVGKAALQRPRDEGRTTSPAPATATGQVQLQVDPGAEVFSGEHRLGITPLPALRLPAGRQTLTIKHARLGVSRDYPVTVPANGEVTLKVELRE